MSCTKPSKVVSVVSLETATDSQLKSILSAIELAHGETDRCFANLCRSDIINNIKQSQEYKHQLLLHPANLVIYCFDGQSRFVCLFQEIDSTNYEIAISKSAEKQYTNYSTSLSFEDKRKIIFQACVARQNHGVIDLPWCALTLNQMISLAKEKCPGLLYSSSITTPTSWLAAKIKKSSEYKKYFKDPRYFDKYITINFDIANPLEVIGWSKVEEEEEWDRFSLLKELFANKKISRKMGENYLKAIIKEWIK